MSRKATSPLCATFKDSMTTSVTYNYSRGKLRQAFEKRRLVCLAQGAAFVRLLSVDQGMKPTAFEWRYDARWSTLLGFHQDGTSAIQEGRAVSLHLFLVLSNYSSPLCENRNPTCHREQRRDIPCYYFLTL